MNLHSFFIKNFKTTFSKAFFAVFFLASFFVLSTETFAEAKPRPISDYLTLWGSDFSTTKDDILSAKKSGIDYIGPKSFEKGGFSEDGTLKKITVPITLLIDTTKYREWNMVIADFSIFKDRMNLNSKYYLRLLDQSFVARIYQKDDNDKVINESIIPIKKCDFLNCSDNDAQSSTSEADKLISQGKPLNYIVKYKRGSDWFNSIVENYTDGYLGNEGDDVEGDDAGGLANLKYTNAYYGLGATIGWIANSKGPALISGQKALVDLNIKNPLNKGTRTYLELWYLGSDRLTTETKTRPAGEGAKETPPYPNTGNNKVERVAYFDIKIDGHNNKEFPFFQIGGTAYFDTPSTFEEASSLAETAKTEASLVSGLLVDSQESNESTLPVCHILNGAGPGEGTFMGCIAQLGYYLLYQPSAWIAGVLGKSMDFFLGYSISDESYRASVIVTGWKLVRDISNIFFIIILMWTGFATVFDIGGISMKKVVPALIINALIINFSLFGTQVVIDISNITARLFYNTMSVCDGPCKYKDPPHEKEIANPNTNDTIMGYKPLSVKIVDSFDPQRIFKPGILGNKNVRPNRNIEKDETIVSTAAGGFNSSGISNNLETAEKSGIYDADYAGYFLIVSIIAAIIMLAMAKMFFSVMFMFVGRVVGLYMTMIFSPFAVITRGNMPLVSGIKELSWDAWVKDLTNYALLAPIFVFFLYIIYAFINSDMLSIIILSDEGFMNTVISIIIPMIIIYMLIDQGVTIAKRYAGKAGETIQKFASSATGMVAGAALGVATGGAAFAGTRLAGVAKLSEANRARLAAKKAEGGFVGRLASVGLNLNDKAQTGSFDMRNTKAFGAINSLAGKTGIQLNDKFSSAVGLGVGSTKGGMKAVDKKEKDALKKKIESISTDVDDEKVAKIWAAKAKKLEEKEKERMLNNEEYLMKAHRDSGKSEAEVKAMKENNTLKDSAAELAKNKIKDDYGDVTNSKQLTQALRQEFAQTIAEGRTLGQQVGAPIAAIKTAAGAAVAAPLATALTMSGAGLVLGAAGYDQHRKGKKEKENANKYFDDSIKNRKKGITTKDQRLEATKKKLTDEIAEMTQYVNGIQGELSKHFDEIIDKANNGTADEKKKYEKFKNRLAGSYGKDDEAVAIKIHRQKQNADLEGHDYDIKSKNDEIGIAKRANKDEAFIKKLETERASLIAKRDEKRESLRMTDDKERSKKEADLTKTEESLERIKEKEDKAKEAKDAKK